MLILPRAICILICLFMATPLFSQPRIISIGGDVTEIIFALGEGKQLVARDTTSFYPSAVTALPDIGYMRQLNIEGILALHPSIVIANDQAKPNLVLSQLADNGVTVVIVPGITQIKNIPTKIKIIAQALQREIEGEKLITQFEQQLAKVQPKQVDIKIMAILNYGGMTPVTAGKGNVVDELITSSGAINSANFSGYRPLSQEGIAAMNPDIVLITQMGLDNLGGVAQLWRIPGLQHTPAGQQKRLIIIDDHALNLSLQTPKTLLQIQQSF